MEHLVFNISNNLHAELAIGTDFQYTGLGSLDIQCNQGKEWKRRSNVIVWISSCSLASCDTVRSVKSPVRQRLCLTVTAHCVPHRRVSYRGFF